MGEAYVTIMHAGRHTGMQARRHAGTHVGVIVVGYFSQQTHHKFRPKVKNYIG